MTYEMRMNSLYKDGRLLCSIITAMDVKSSAGNALRERIVSLLNEDKAAAKEQFVMENRRMVIDRLPQLLSAIAAMHSEYYAKFFPSSPSLKPIVTFTIGPRYLKLITESPGHKAVYCFVNLMNGDILKAASWSAPARHARSNIFDDDFGLSGLDIHGARYL